MGRTRDGRLRTLESYHWLRYFQQAILDVLQATADEVGLSAAACTALRTAVQDWCGQYLPPPTGWESDYDQAFAVADAHTLMLRRILEQSLPDRAILTEVCQSLRDKLTTFARGCADDT